jgi:hypothetical protein
MDKGAFYLEKMQEHDLRWAKSKENGHQSKISGKKTPPLQSSTKKAKF